MPLGAKSESPSCSPALKDSNHAERTGRPDSPERAGQQQRDASRKLGARRASQEKRKTTGAAAACENTIDLTAFNEHTDSNSDDGNDDNSSTSLRKRKLSLGGGDVPAKRPAELPVFL